MAETKEDLLKFYKHVLACKKCNRIYGNDSPEDDGVCPICYHKSPAQVYKGRQKYSIIKRMVLRHEKET